MARPHRTPPALSSFLFSLVLWSACGVEPESVGRPPNIVFLFSDDQRADTIGAWGNEWIRTPSIDRLVDRGFSFRSNYNQGGSVGAVCVPSRAMVNSGLSYFHVKNDLSDGKLLPEVLRQNGYATFGTGKWHNEQPSFIRGFEQGKAVFFGGMCDHTQVPLVDLGVEGELVNERTGDGFSSELFADAAIEFLEHRDKDRPFYLYVAFTAPHDPRQPPAEYRETYYRSLPPLPGNFMPQHPFNLGGWLTGRDENLAAWPRTEAVIRDQLAEYYGLITHLDAQIGRILDKLDELDLTRTTLVVFASDQGLALGSHGLLGKQSVYEHSQKCPLILAGPGIPRGSTTALTYLLDLVPTLLSTAGADLPPGLDGKDLSVLWKGEQQAVRETLFLAFTDQMRAVRDNRYKLIICPQVGLTRLFDLREDPDEMTDLAAVSALSPRLEALTASMLEWQRQLGDTQQLRVPEPEPMEVDLTGHEREPDRWQPEWIVRKYFP